MPSLLFPIEQFKTQPNFSVAIVLCIHKDSSFLHSGIVYKERGSITFQHLAYHKALRSEDLSQIIPDYNFFVYTNFLHFIKTDPHFFRRKAFIAYLQAIFEKNKDTIPYSFLFKKVPFDSSRTYNPKLGQYGLTCSTYVMAVLEDNGIELCAKDSWPIREEDREIQKEIISIYKRYPKVSVDHIKIMESELGCIRFRPEEVLCSSSKFPLPSKFEDTVDCAKKALANANPN